MQFINFLGSETVKSIVHVGAHYGEELSTYQALSPELIVWVEADPECFQMLERAIATHGSSQIKNVCINALITDQDNENRDFFVFSNEGGSSSIYHSTQELKDTWTDLRETGTLTLQTARLDTVLSKVGLLPDELDVLVVDIQGAEMLCLAGAGKYLNSVKFLEVEIAQEAIYEGGVLFPELDGWLRSQGFTRISAVPWHGNCVYRKNPVSVPIKAQDSESPIQPKRFASLGDLSPAQFQGQCGQDYWIHKKYFSNKPNGVFVDVGANDGVHLSSSYFFEKHMGWSGLCIEPNYQCFDSLYRNRSCTIIPCAVGETVTVSRMEAITGELSVLSVLTQHRDPRHQSRMEREAQSQQETIFSFNVLQLPLGLILEANQISKIDYLKVDVEGAELAVIKSINWEKVSVAVIEIEDNFGDAKTHDFLKSQGYILDSIFDSFVYIYVTKSLHRP